MPPLPPFLISFSIQNEDLYTRETLFCTCCFCRPGVEIVHVRRQLEPCIVLMAFEQGSLSCRACCDTGHLFPWPPDLVAYRKKN